MTQHVENQTKNSYNLEGGTQRRYDIMGTRGWTKRVLCTLLMGTFQTHFGILGNVVYTVYGWVMSTNLFQFHQNLCNCFIILE